MRGHVLSCMCAGRWCSGGALVMVYCGSCSIKEVNMSRITCQHALPTDAWTAGSAPLCRRGALCAEGVRFVGCCAAPRDPIDPQPHAPGRECCALGAGLSICLPSGTHRLMCKRRPPASCGPRCHCPSHSGHKAQQPVPCGDPQSTAAQRAASRSLHEASGPYWASDGARAG